MIADFDLIFVHCGLQRRDRVAQSRLGAEDLAADGEKKTAGINDELFDSLTSDDLEGLDPAVLKQILQDEPATRPRRPSTRSSITRLSVQTSSGKASSPGQGGRGQKRFRAGT